MSDDRFIELLNLYLDDEASPHEVEELMREVRLNASRYETYMEYSRLHAACSLCFAAAVREGGQGSNRFANWRQTAYALGGFAAALALIALASSNLRPIFSPDEGMQESVAGVRSPQETVTRVAPVSTISPEERGFSVESPTLAVKSLVRSQVDFAKAGVVSHPRRYGEGLGVGFGFDRRKRSLELDEQLSLQNRRLLLTSDSPLDSAEVEESTNAESEFDAFDGSVEDLGIDATRFSLFGPEAQGVDRYQAARLNR